MTPSPWGITLTLNYEMLSVNRLLLLHGGVFQGVKLKPVLNCRTVALSRMIVIEVVKAIISRNPLGF